MVGSLQHRLGILDVRSPDARLLLLHLEADLLNQRHHLVVGQLEAAGVGNALFIVSISSSGRRSILSERENRATISHRVEGTHVRVVGVMLAIAVIVMAVVSGSAVLEVPEQGA